MDRVSQVKREVMLNDCVEMVHECQSSDLCVANSDYLVITTWGISAQIGKCFSYFANWFFSASISSF